MSPILNALNIIYQSYTQKAIDADSQFENIETICYLNQTRVTKCQLLHALVHEKRQQIRRISKLVKQLYQIS